MSEQEKQFFAQHRIEENKFKSFEEAERFFNKMGFVIDKAAQPDYAKLSSLKYFRKSLHLFDFFKMLFFRKAARMRKTWRLKPAA